MKKIINLLLLLPVLALGQTPTENYVRTRVYKEETSSSDPSKANAAVTYYDGLGRPIQQVAGKASGVGTDIITHIEYDAYGRQIKEYLPYKSGNTGLEFVTDAKTATLNFYNTQAYESTQNPYSEKKLESSPLSRVLKTAAPGNPWKIDVGQNITFAYASNGENEVLKFAANATWNSTTELYDAAFVADGYYAPGALYRTQITDENGVVTREYKNKEGQLVCKINAKGSEDLVTYYIYDQYGNLSFVLPPLAEGTLDPGLCYYYKYDKRNRLVEKKIPAKGWEYMVYDRLDRIVATGPAYSPFADGTIGWLRTYYDTFNRVCVTGWTPASDVTTDTRKALQSNSDTPVTLVRGSGTIDNIAISYAATPLAGNLKLLTVNYYDNYTWQGSPFTQGGIDKVELQDVNYNIKGQPTGTWDRVLTAPTEGFAQISSTLYDKKYRPIRTRTNNYLGGFTQADIKLDFDGTPQYTITTHKRTGSDTVLTTREDFTYTPEDRLLTHTHKINNNAPELMVHNTYDNLGQLKSKKVGGADTTGSVGLQKVDFEYNIRGWLKGINNIDNLNPTSTEEDLFAFKLSYNTPTNVNTAVLPLFNGNVTETYWRTQTDNNVRKYGYVYDQANRLLDAYY